MRSALCALALILLLPNTVTAEETSSEPDSVDLVACEPISADNEPPYAEVHPECIGGEASTESK